MGEGLQFNQPAYYKNTKSHRVNVFITTMAFMYNMIWLTTQGIAGIAA